MRLIINIYSKGKFPADQLSNFTPYPFSFQFDGTNTSSYYISSMEAFLQSLKFKKPNEQEQIWSLTAKEAKRVGSTQTWEKYLYWRGKPIDRFSTDYSRLVNAAYQSMFEQNKDFRKALEATRGRILLHTIGKWRRRKTVLTWWEFVRVLYKLRKTL